MKKKKVNKTNFRSCWTHKFINKVIPDKRNKKPKHKKRDLSVD